MQLFISVKTKFEWIESVSKVPVLGHFFLFLLIFIPAVTLSFLAQAVIPGLQNDVGFTKAMLVLLPLCNLVAWINEIRLYLLFLPSWAILGVIALIKFFTGSY